MGDKKEEYLIFSAEVVEGKCEYEIINNKQEHLGVLRKVRVGQWLSWCLFLNPGCYLSASCIDEVRCEIKRLNTSRVVAL